ncbi:MAG: threonylcarbamoyl-AMP synthase [Bacteroidales bacterium]|nr:threonylcarbamoyl-AMP synthase [Bacteroidales bacterium]
MLLKIHPETPSLRQIKKVVDCLNSGGIIIYPTDTIYGLGCDIFNSKAIDKIARLKGIKKEKANFSFLCHDLSHISDFTKPFSNPVYKLMKSCLPGPFTFILNGNSNVPRIFQSKKKTVGIRVPDNNIILEIIRELGNPIMSTSIHDDDEIVEYTTDPELIYERYKDKVDIVINGGYGDNQPSTIIDCTTDEAIIIREGKGVL